jgi:hypothetical protein
MCTAIKRVNRGVARAALVAATSAILLMIAAPIAMSQQGGSVLNQDQVPNELLVKFAVGVSTAQATETIQRTGAQIIGAPVLDGRLFHVRTSDPSLLAAVKSALAGAPGVEYVEAVYTVRTEPKASK